MHRLVIAEEILNTKKDNTGDLVTNSIHLPDGAFPYGEGGGLDWKPAQVRRFRP